MHSGGMKVLALAGFAALLTGSAAMAAPAALTLIGEDGWSQVVSLDDLKALPHTGATISHDGKTYGFKGVLLADVLKRVGAPLGAAMRGPALSDVVILTARDGYVVSLALSDLEPSIRDGKVILADAAADGSALGEKDGPFRLVVDGDLKPARSERDVTRIELRRLRLVH